MKLYEIYELIAVGGMNLEEGLEVFLSELQIIINYNKQKVKPSLREDLEQEIRMKILEVIDKQKFKLQVVLPELREGSLIIDEDNGNFFATFVNLYYNRTIMDQNAFNNTEYINTLISEYTLFVANKKFKKFIEITIKNSTIDFIRKNYDEMLYVESIDEFEDSNTISTSRDGPHKYCFDEWKSYLSPKEVDFITLFIGGTVLLKKKEVAEIMNVSPQYVSKMFKQIKIKLQTIKNNMEKK